MIYIHVHIYDHVSTICDSQTQIKDRHLQHLLLNCPTMNVTGLHDDQSTLVQVMVWCRQATNHYLSQCLSRSLSPYGVTRPQ